MQKWLEGCVHNLQSEQGLAVQSYITLNSIAFRLNVSVSVRRNN